MAELGKFLLAVVAHWIAVMSSLVSVLIALWLRVKHKPDIPDAVFWGIAALCLFYACFAAWRVEFRKVGAETRSLDDRRRQQELADAYQPCLHTGHKLSVRWSEAVRLKDEALLSAVSKEGLAWY